MPKMAEPKKRQPAGGRPKGPRAPRKVIVAFKGYEEFDDWLRGLANDQRLPVSVLIEHAVIAYAKQAGYKPEAPER